MVSMIRPSMMACRWTDLVLSGNNGPESHANGAAKRQGALSGLIPVWTNTPRIHRATTVLVILGAVHDELCRAVED